MAIYALGITPLLAQLNYLSIEKAEKFSSRQVVFADDLNGIGSLENFKKWWDLLEQEGGLTALIRIHQYTHEFGRYNVIFNTTTNC